MTEPDPRVVELFPKPKTERADPCLWVAVAITVGWLVFLLSLVALVLL